VVDRERVSVREEVHDGHARGRVPHHDGLAHVRLHQSADRLGGQKQKPAKAADADGEHVLRTFSRLRLERHVPPPR
jgi:hypothetical protein